MGQRVNKYSKFKIVDLVKAIKFKKNFKLYLLDPKLSDLTMIKLLWTEPVNVAKF